MTGITPTIPTAMSMKLMEAWLRKHHGLICIIINIIHVGGYSMMALMRLSFSLCNMIDRMAQPNPFNMKKERELTNMKKYL